MHKQPKTTHLVVASARINAPAGRVYTTLADYRNGHPPILPTEFSGMTVERGGTGQGTIVRFNMRLLGKTQTYRAAVTEPEPGRVLVEKDLETNGAVATFTVNPGPDETKSDVTIVTELPVRGGLVGAIERTVTTRLLRPIYIRELALLAAQVEPPGVG
ncbi:MAG TPA: SRPBCC family protein [Bryobacteraceae bacterium]|nr:SRPBCC family protein [Bryobacteraceae bacterium]